MGNTVNNLITRLILQNKEFDGNLKRSEKEMKNFQKQISSQVGGVQKSFSSTLGVVGKLAPAIAVAGGGIATFKGIINSTRSSQEAFNTVIDQAKATTDVFFQSIARADFSNFTSEVSAAVKAAGEYRRALEDLQFREFASAIELSGIDVEEAQTNAKVKEKENVILKSNNEDEKIQLRSELDVLNKELDSFREKRMRINQSISEEAEKNVRASLKVQLKTQKDYTENVLTLLKDENKERLKEYAGYYAVQDRISKSKTDYGVGVSMGSTTYKSSNKEAEEWLNSDAAIPYKIAYELSTKTKEQQEEIKNNVLKWTGAELKIAQEQGKKYDDEKKILGMKKANSGGSSTSAKETKQVETMSEKYNNLVVKIQEVSEALREAKRNGDIFGQIENTELLNKLNKERDGILENIRLYEKFKNTISKPLPPSFSFSTNEEGKKASKGKPYPVVSQSKMTDYSFELSAIAKKNIVNAREEFERMKEENELLENSFANLGNELLNFGNAIGGISDNPGLRALAASLMILSGVEKLAKSVTVWDFIAGAIGLASSIVAFGSQVSSAKFAGGGIVGDQNIVRMNEGELILNKAQQTRLFNQINSGEIGTHSSNQYEFVIRGENLVGVQKNYNSKFNK